MHRAGDTAVAPAAPGPLVTVIAAVLCCNHCHWAAVRRRAGAGALSRRNLIFLPPLEPDRAPCKVPCGECERISHPGPFPTRGVVTSSMTLSWVLSPPQPQRWGRLLWKRGNSRKREFGEAPRVSRRGERSWSVKGEGNDAAQRYGARKTRLASEKCLPQARCPRCRGAAPDRKMPCSMRPVPGKGVLTADCSTEDLLTAASTILGSALGLGNRSLEVPRLSNRNPGGDSRCCASSTSPTPLTTSQKTPLCPPQIPASILHPPHKGVSRTPCLRASRGPW
ncbi:uncharacterized protein LOC119707557 [Motacilla alba alba]|uniref:uncharacterized protein LOC119707557 n=1 Tax=Motacilla alba alba TaxID=1094192 RepID=UPI0018D4F4FB|nr:uncharacterized protein LOC119707557 [Motacilla alba alba]